MTSRQRLGWLILAVLVVAFFTLIGLVSGWSVAAGVFGLLVAVGGFVSLAVIGITLITEEKEEQR